MRRGTTALLGLLVSLVALGAGSAAANPAIANRLELSALYSSDHHGMSPKSDVPLRSYAREFQKILASCKINSQNLANDTLWMAGQASSPGAPRVSSLMMMQAITRRITWSRPRPCWDIFDLVEHRLEVESVSAQIVNRHEVSALYVIDHQGAPPEDDVALLSYSSEFQKILGACNVSAEDLTNLMIQLADKASELGARHVSSLMMMQAVTRRITWTKPRIVCSNTFDLAEGHMETGGP